MRSLKKLLPFIGASFIFHALLFAPYTGQKTPSEKAAIQSPLRIDCIQIPAEKPTAKESRKSSLLAAKEESSRSSLKGQEAEAADKYLAYVRQEIVSRQKYPFAAKKLKLSALYEVVIQIFPGGEFEFQISSSNGHPLFERSIEKLFKDLGKFKPPPNEAGDVMTVELVLEFLS